MMSSSRRRCMAFTLVELLVVVAIIALLLAMLLPALSGAQAAVRNARCMSNLRQLNSAVVLYGVDNRGYAFVSRMMGRNWVSGGSANPGGPVPDDYPDGQWAESFHEPFLGQYTHSLAGRNPWTRPPVNSVWRCPEDIFGIGNDGLAAPSTREVRFLTGVGSGQFFPTLTSRDDSHVRSRMNKLSDARRPNMVMTMLDDNNHHQFGINNWTSSPMYANRKDQRGTARANESGSNAINRSHNHSMRHPPGKGLGTNMGFIDGAVRTIVNTPGIFDGEYWLKDKYRIEFVFRPQELQ